MTDKNEIFRIEKGIHKAPVYTVISSLDDNYPVRTFFTTKNGGVSKDEFKSLNMGFATSDDIDSVKENRKRVFDLLGNEAYTEVRPQQIHGNSIRCVKHEDVEACSEERLLYYPATDATITNVKNVILTSLHADCIPVWLYDPVQHAAGLVHAGWRGTHADIAALTAKAMCSEFGSRMDDIHAVIGPGIDMCCFETGEDVKDAFEEKYGESFFLDASDLTSANLDNSSLDTLNPDTSDQDLLSPDISNQAALSPDAPNQAALSPDVLNQAALSPDVLNQAVLNLDAPNQTALSLDISNLANQKKYDPALCIDDKNGKFHLNLKNINKKLLLRAGIKNIEISGLCTSCRKDLFYSYRRDKGKTGRMCAGIVLL